MRKVELNWFDLGPVRVLYDALRPDDYFRNPSFPELNDFGVYMYVDRKTGKSVYIGQAFKDSLYALRTRVRWEIVKDGSGCAESAFCMKCRERRVNRFDLQLKVAHIKNPKENEVSTKVDEKFMNAIERALIFERACSGDPLINETGKDNYGLGTIEIVNNGDSSPLPPRVKQGLK